VAGLAQVADMSPHEAAREAERCDWMTAAAG